VHEPYITVAGLPDLARLVHGNSRSIQKLVREFCEFWRSTNLTDTASGDAVPDENAQVVKVSKRRVEAKIREIAVYELRPQCCKYKLWYVNDKTLEELNLSLPVPTKWKWITLESAVKTTEANAAAVTKPAVVTTSNVQPSPTTTNGTIKLFMSPKMPNGPQQQSVMGNKDSCGVDQSPSQSLKQSSPEGLSNVDPVNSSSPVCVAVVSDGAASAGAKRDRENPVRSMSTPCSTSAAKKRKMQAARRHSLPAKQQLRLLFSKKMQPPQRATDDCIVVDSDSVPSTEPSNVGDVRQQADDCMIVDIDSQHSTQPDAGARQHGDADILVLSDEKSLPGTDANCNVCTESTTDDINKPAEASANVDN